MISRSQKQLQVGNGDSLSYPILFVKQAAASASGADPWPFAHTY